MEGVGFGVMAGLGFSLGPWVLGLRALGLGFRVQGFGLRG